MQYYNQENKQVNFLVETAHINSESKVLDLGFGRGYHLAKIRELTDCNIYGFDTEKSDLLNTYQLDIFKDKWLEEFTNFDLIYSLSPYYGQDWWNIESLVEKVSISLKNNGFFVLDHFDFNCFRIGRRIKDFKLLDEKVILSEFVRKEGRMDCYRIFIDKEFNKELVDLTWRVFEQEELENIFSSFNLKNLGFAYNYEPKLGSTLNIDRVARISSVWQK